MDQFWAFPTAWWASDRAVLYHGEVREVLRRLPARSVHCVVTSPPYWGLRDYGVDGQIGAEATPEEYITSMVEVFREVHRVLRDDGVLWLNLGDTYIVSTGLGLPQGNLTGIPWRTALALQADGWVLRSDLPWVKRSAMPDSCENRPGKSLEYVFMLVKSGDYYFDMDAVRSCDSDRGFRNGDLWFASVDKPYGLVGVRDELVGLDVTPKGYKGAHYAVFPPDLIEPLILSSTSKYGCCALCKRPWERIATRTGGTVIDRRNDNSRDRSFNWSRNGKTGSSSTLDGVTAKKVTTGWQRLCGCGDSEVIPCVVLDPFAGSGTTPATAVLLGRAGIGIDLSEVYLRDNAVPRVVAALAGHGIACAGATAVQAGHPPVAMDVWADV